MDPFWELLDDNLVLSDEKINTLMGSAIFYKYLREYYTVLDDSGSDVPEEYISLWKEAAKEMAEIRSLSRALDEYKQQHKPQYMYQLIKRWRYRQGKQARKAALKIQRDNSKRRLEDKYENTQQEYLTALKGEIAKLSDSSGVDKREFARAY